MRSLVIIAILAGAFGVVGLANAQNSSQAPRGESAVQMYDTCAANGYGALECACMAGFYGGRLQPEEFRLLAVLNAHVDANGDIGDMPAAQQAMRSEAARIGMSDERFLQAMQRFSTMDRDGAEGDQVCTALRGK